MGMLIKILVSIGAALLTWAITSLIVLPMLPLRDLGACVGVLFWLVPPIVVLCVMPKTWGTFIAAREQRRLAAEAEIRAVRHAEKQRIRAAREAEQQKVREAEELRKELKRLEEEADGRRRNKQRELTDRAASLLGSSHEIAAGFPNIANKAEAALDQAEQEFADGAFAPFWDAIEEAVNELAAFNRKVKQIIANRDEYRLILPEMEQTPGPFIVGIDLIPDATSIAERMSKIVRRAQKDYHFASIYEKRKTNQLLVRGFASLGEALRNLSSSLQYSISDLNSSLSDRLSELTSVQREATSQARADAREARERAASQAEEAARLMTEAAAALDEHHSEERDLLEEIRDQTKPRDD